MSFPDLRAFLDQLRRDGDLVEVGAEVDPVQEAAEILPAETDCECLHAARHAIITAPEMISDEVKERLQVLYGHYFEQE